MPVEKNLLETTGSGLLWLLDLAAAAQRAEDSIPGRPDLQRMGADGRVLIRSRSVLACPRRAWDEDFQSNARQWGD